MNGHSSPDTLLDSVQYIRHDHTEEIQPKRQEFDESILQRPVRGALETKYTQGSG